MGYSFFVCRVNGKVSTDANESYCNIYDDGTYYDVDSEQPKDKKLVEENMPYDNSKGMQKDKVLVSKKFYDKLCKDVENVFGFKCYISERTLPKYGNWEYFWNLLDEWVKKRKNKALINKICQWTYGSDMPVKENKKDIYKCEKCGESNHDNSRVCRKDGKTYCIKCWHNDDFSALLFKLIISSMKH